MNLLFRYLLKIYLIYVIKGILYQVWPHCVSRDTDLPTHFPLSSVYPWRQLHLYEPIVLVHTLLMSSQIFELWHSSMSVSQLVPVHPFLQIQPCTESQCWEPRPQLHLFEQFSPKFGKVHAVSIRLLLFHRRHYFSIWSIISIKYFVVVFT